MKKRKKMPSLEDYTNPTQDYVLPGIPVWILRKLAKSTKPVLLKKNIINKNKLNHPELSIEEYNIVLSSGLYNTQEILQPNFRNKPNYFDFVARTDKNNVVVIELAEDKKNYEIVGFFKVNAKELKKLKRRTSRDGGQSIITDR